jgi:glycosyltransferase involved in cell wall biosynthesis
VKVVHIIPTLRRGGAERLVIDIVRALSKRNDCEVRLVIFRNEIAYIVDDIQKMIVHIPAQVSLSVLNANTINVDELQDFFNQFKPDVIHSHLFEAEVVSRSCFYPEAKWFSHCHDNMVQFKNFTIDTIFHKHLATNFYEKQYLKKRYHKNSGNTFLAISKNTLAYFDKTMHEYRSLFLPNAINYERFRYKGTNRVPEQTTLTLINTGTFDDNKNQVFLIHVAKELDKNGCKFEMHFLGDGKNLRMVQSYSNGQKFADKIYFHGSVENVENYLWTADIYVHSAKSEALGLTIIEAMAAGLPVVTLDGKGNRDLIESGKNGYMIFNEDADEFAEKVLEIWKNKEIHKTMSQYAENYARKFDISDYIERLLSIYNGKD